MEVKWLAITPEGLKPVEPEEVKVDLDAMPQHRRERFIIKQLELIRQWVAEQEAAENNKGGTTSCAN